MTPPRTVVALALVAVTWVGVAAGAQGSAAIPLASGGRSECRRGFSAGVLALAWSFPVAVVRGQGPVGPAEPEVVADGNGGLHAVWIDYRKGPAMPAVMYARRDPAGAWGPAEEVRGAEAMVAVTDPQVAVDAMGQVHAVWAETRGADPDVYASLRGQGGAWRAPYRVNDDAGGAWQETPRALGDLWGNLHVVWTDYRQGNADIYHSRIRPGGRPGRNVRVNEPAGGDQTEPRLALTPGGDLHAVWQDTRAGSADIYASMVPHAGLSPELADADVVWWPNARLNSEALVDRQTAPAVVAGAGGEVRAVWVDADSRLRTAVLTPAEPFWQPDTPLYDAGAARLSAPRLAVDPSGAVVVAWLTTAGGGTGVWSAAISAAGLGEASRIDDTPITRGADALALAVGPLSIAHVLWAGPSRFGGAAVYYSAAQMPPPDYRRERHRGWLTYIPGRMNCAGDGFLLRTCGGETGPFVRLPSVPANFIGRWVEAEGTLVAGTRCPVLRADKVVLATAPCPDDSGAITGVVRRLGVPMPGARVSSGGKTATTGVSGRFFLEGLPGGSHDLVLEAPCALEATLVGARVQAGFTLVVPDAEAVAGDVTSDCRVDLLDLVRVTLQYKAAPPFRPACSDVNADGRVAIGDVAIVGANYGLACPTGWRDGAPAPGSAAVKGRALRSSAGAPAMPRDRATEDGSREEPMLELRVASPGGFEAFAVTLSFGAGFEPADMDPERPGIQPFRVAGGDPHGMWVVANAADLDDGLLELAVAGLSGTRWPGPEATVAFLGAGAGAPIGIDSLELAGATGIRLPGVARLEAASAPSGRRVWLPRVGSSPRQSGWPGRTR